MLVRKNYFFFGAIINVFQFLDFIFKKLFVLFLVSFVELNFAKKLD